MLRRVSGVLWDRWNYWHPSVADRPRTARLLAEFYAGRIDYHALTAKSEKRQHPQVQLLLSSIKQTDICVEFGCGGSVVLGAAAQKAAKAIGMDVARIGLQKTTCRLSKVRSAFAVQSDVAYAPLRAGAADVAYCLEVLERVWDPEAVLLEMIRVLRPGGLLFLTTPNGFSLDLHLKLRPSVRAINLLGGAFAHMRSAMSNRIFRNTEPSLNTVPSYSDCDMITKIFPPSLERCLRRNGCRDERLETLFFQKAKATTSHGLRNCERWNAYPFYRYFGDHILLLARKIR